MHPLYQANSDEWDTLYSSGNYYNEKHHELRKKIDALDKNDPEREKLILLDCELDMSGEHLTPEANALNKKFEQIRDMQTQQEIQYAKDNVSMLGYDYITQNIRAAVEHYKTDISPITEVYNKVYKAKYPDHPYTTMIENYIQASTVKEGGQYIDVTAKDIDGKDVKLSGWIDGKVAVIHLWASWCGPCRKSGQELIPIYNEYKDKGFTVVGIARENNKESMITALEKDNHPWVNLLELNDYNNIWAKYGIGNSGGKDFLVDNTGKILAVAPSAEQVREILGNLLN